MSLNYEPASEPLHMGPISRELITLQRSRSGFGPGFRWQFSTLMKCCISARQVKWNKAYVPDTNVMAGLPQVLLPDPS